MLSISEPEYLPAWPDVCIALCLPLPLPFSLSLSLSPSVCLSISLRLSFSRQTASPEAIRFRTRAAKGGHARGAKRQPLANLRSRKRIYRTASYVRMQFTETHVHAESNGYYYCGPLLVSPSSAEIRPRECRRREKIAPVDPSIAPSDSIRLENSAFQRMLYFKLGKMPPLAFIIKIVSP